ncbi:MAG TPA: SDR family NAD(P)-dependent oxidoreductase [Solirubrobacteraceae bacterium]|nr:SDR family NAD(P)-dependent oxidoreductase [Solirubrobacteraceae bacterium]
MTTPATVAITGAANGIGLATATRFSRAGARVTIGDIDGEAALRAAAVLGDNVTGTALDVSDEASFGAFLEIAEQTHGRLELVINNAGVDWVGRFDAEPTDVSRRQLEVNLLGAIIGSRLALRRMLPRSSGHIVNVASTVGRVPQPHSAVYSATKWGIVGLTESLRLEYRDSGVRISLVHPGLIQTAMIDGTARPSRLVPLLSADDCAKEIIDAVARNRFEVWAPRTGWVGPKLANFVPRAVRDRAMLAIGLADIAGRADTQARRRYHERAFRGKR